MPWTFLGDRFNRLMLVFCCLHVLTVGLLMWYLVKHPRPAGRIAEVLLGVAIGLFVSLGVDLFLRD